MPHKVYHTLICDDIRREDNGKEILIGMLNETAVIKEVPAVLSSFAVRFLIQPNKTKYETVISKIIDPDGADVVVVNLQFAFQSIQYPASFFYRISPMLLKTYGLYQIWLGLDEDPVLVSSFQVIPPSALSEVQPHVPVAPKKARKTARRAK